MAAVTSQSIDRSNLGVAVREAHEDPGSMAMMCCDLGFGKQTTFFQEEVAPSAEPILAWDRRLHIVPCAHTAHLTHSRVPVLRSLRARRRSTKRRWPCWPSASRSWSRCA